MGVDSPFLPILPTLSEAVPQIELRGPRRPASSDRLEDEERSRITPIGDAATGRVVEVGVVGGVEDVHVRLQRAIARQPEPVAGPQVEDLEVRATRAANATLVFDRNCI